MQGKSPATNKPRTRDSNLRMKLRSPEDLEAAMGALEEQLGNPDLGYGERCTAVELLKEALQAGDSSAGRRV